MELVSTEWSTYSGSFACHARDNVAPLWQNLGRRLDANNDTKIVHLCRTQTSSHSSQGVVDDRVSEAGVSTAAPGRSAALCCSQCCCHSTQSEPASCQECNVWCQFFANSLKVSAIRGRPIQCYSEVFGLRTKGQGFIVVVDFQLRFTFLVVEVEDCWHCFCSAGL